MPTKRKLNEDGHSVKTQRVENQAGLEPVPGCKRMEGQRQDTPGMGTGPANAQRRGAPEAPADHGAASARQEAPSFEAWLRAMPKGASLSKHGFNVTVYLDVDCWFAMQRLADRWGIPFGEIISQSIDLNWIYNRAGELEDPMEKHVDAECARAARLAKQSPTP